MRVRAVLVAITMLVATLSGLLIFGPAEAAEVNLARLKTATQSSTEYSGVASRAVDGNTNSRFSLGSVTHTRAETAPYWQVDLGAAASIAQVVVWNRSKYDCCADRLSNFWVITSPNPITARDLATAKSANGATAQRVGSLSGPAGAVAVNKSARYVRIQLEGSTPLSLAEVQVFGNSTAANSAAQRFVDQNDSGLFLHYNMGTYTNEQWATPKQDPKKFAPTSVDTDQWARAAKSAGMTYSVLTAKHHDGFALWPTACSTYDVAACSYPRDIVRDYVNSTRAAGLKVGIYFSAWDRTNGDSTALMQCQLRELLTNYGQIDYLWIDGWAWGVPYSKIPYQPVRDFIRQVSPSTVVANNDQKFTVATSDIIMTDANVAQIPDSPFPKDHAITLDSKQTWFASTTTGAPQSAQWVINWLNKARASNGMATLNAGPGKNGRLAQAEIDRLAEIGRARGVTS